MKCLNGPVGVRASASTSNSKSQIANRFATAALIAAAVSAGTAKAYDPPPDTYFPIGVFLQPTSTFATWKARGVNTVVEFDPNVQSETAWNAAAVQNGLYQIRAPDANIANDVNNPWLVAWSQHDEPELNGISQSALQNAYNSMKAADPKRPVYINFAGGNVMNPNDSFNDAFYQTEQKAGDWVSEDIYPVTGWGRPDWIDYSKNPTDMRWNSGLATDKLRQLSGGKMTFAYVETSNQQLSWVPNDQGANAAQVRGETWDAIIHGAKGIVYFPQQIGNGFKYDATPAAVVTEITKQNALISSLAAVINAGDDATDNKISLTSGGKNVQDLEGTWRNFGGHEYLFVLNMSTDTLSNLKFSAAGLSNGGVATVFNESRSTSISAGTLTDSFSPYQLHVYELSAGVGAAVPEPTTLGLFGIAGGALLRRRRRS